MKPDPLMSLYKYFRQCVGIDISKDKFTACLFMYDRGNDVGCCTESIDFPQSKTGFNQLVKWSRREAQKGFPMPFLMEPTSTYYEKLAYHLHKIGQTVYIVLPSKARKFCEYEGIKTKTDPMDARCLALMGCVSRKLRPKHVISKKGNATSRAWNDKEGKAQSQIKVSADRIDFINFGKRKVETQQPSGDVTVETKENEPFNQPDTEEDLPF
ncbi:MAG: transposase [Bacteroidaceae bacterium]|nr:transposase [Bacteroidaceae bacterium]